MSHVFAHHEFLSSELRLVFLRDHILSLLILHGHGIHA